MTRPDETVAPPDTIGARPSRVVARVPGIPGARAVVGGVLVAVAVVGTFVSWQSATSTPDRSYAVAARPLQPGERLAPDAVRYEAIDLPEGVAAAAFESPGELEGRVVVAPVGEGELLQLGSVSDQVGGPPAAEVSVTLRRDLAVDGRLRPGDRVDVYATEDDTTVAAEGLRVVAVTEAGGSFADGRELTVTLALTDPASGAPIIQAAREGQVTLVRTTHAPTAAASAGATPEPASGAETPAGDGPPATSGEPSTSGEPPADGTAPAETPDGSAG